MSEITTVTITQGTPDLPVRDLAVTAEVITTGLAITPALDKDNGLLGSWTVTHMPTGYVVAPIAGCIGCMRYAARHLTGGDIDWTSDVERFKADEKVEKAVRDFTYDAGGCDGAECGITGAVPQAA